MLDTTWSKTLTCHTHLVGCHQMKHYYFAELTETLSEGVHTGILLLFRDDLLGYTGSATIIVLAGAESDSHCARRSWCCSVTYASMSRNGSVTDDETSAGRLLPQQPSITKQAWILGAVAVEPGFYQGMRPPVVLHQLLLVESLAEKHLSLMH